ncbi:MAG TPA: response regulator [bacterium]|nr:response regulator [bacterium]
MSAVIVVDDSPSSRSLLVDLCLAAGADSVEACASGFEAIRALPRLADVALVITDVNMPDITGLELVRMLREQPRFRTTPIFVVSTDAQSADAERALTQGATRFFQKPFDAAALSAAVSAALPGKAKGG